MYFSAKGDTPLATAINAADTAIPLPNPTPAQIAAAGMIAPSLAPPAI
jgi:hypothetical protein